jgi:hypothetical protein
MSDKPKYDRSLPFNEKWPDMDKALDFPAIMTALNAWCCDHQEESHSDKGRQGIRDELYRIMCERFESIPHEQLVTAVAEMLSAELLKGIVDHITGELGLDTKGKEDGFTWLKKK